MSSFTDRSDQSPSPITVIHLSENQQEVQQRLLALWLRLSPQERQKHFAETARAAELSGVARRTMQMWIERGYVQALRLGRKHQIHLASVQEYLLQGGRIVTDKNTILSFAQRTERLF